MWVGLDIGAGENDRVPDGLADSAAGGGRSQDVASLVDEHHQEPGGPEDAEGQEDSGNGLGHGGRSPCRLSGYLARVAAAMRSSHCLISGLLSVFSTVKSAQRFAKSR